MGQACITESFDKLKHMQCLIGFYSIVQIGIW